MKRSLLALLLALTLLGFASPLPAAHADVPTYVFGVPDSQNIEDWNTNAQTLYIEEKLGVNLEFLLLPANAAEQLQKLELMILAGGADLPDVLLDTALGGLSSLELYGQMGMILPLNEYYGNTPYLDANLATFQEPPMTKAEFMKYLTCSDGNIYTLGKCFVSMSNFFSNARLMIYEPWLDKLDLAVPETTDQLVEVLRAFRDQDPNGNGLADEVPMMGFNSTVMSNMARFLMNPFIYTQEHYLINNDGVIGFAANQEGWKEGLKFIKGLFDEQLISSLSLTQDVSQYKSILSAPETVIGSFLDISASKMASTDPRRAEYVVVGALEGPSGLRQSTRMDTLPGPAFVITKNCKDPAGAFAIGDFLSSIEMSIWTRYGREGEEWIWLDEPGESMYASLGYKGEIKEFNSFWASLQNVYWCQIGPNVLDNSQFGYRFVVEQNEGVYNNLKPIARTIYRELDWANTQNRVQGLIFSAQEQEVVTEYRSTINDYVAEMFAQFVTGITDIDAGWDKYAAEFDNMGLEPYLAAVQSCWDRMN